jgi:outer membrane protein assembly factor BamE (lipoprotein component of BamABCDE complex)
MNSLLLFLLVVFTTACEPIIDNRGYFFHDEVIAKIKPNKSTEEKVLEILGSPTIARHILIKNKPHKLWYYISKKTETTSFFRPKMIEEDVLRILFNAQNVVVEKDFRKNVKYKDIEADSEQTPTTGYEESVSSGFFDTFERMFKPANKQPKEA